MQTDSIQLVQPVQEAVAGTVQPIADAVSVAAVEPAWYVQLLGDLDFGGGDKWGEMLLMAALGFGVVFVVLVLLIFIMKCMGLVFTRQQKAAKIAAKGAVAADEQDAMSDQEIAAAIITALKLYKSNLHDQESEIITINRITRAYSPWNSKIHGLTQLPEHK
jgi:sodium pump decarboxylase gamma subunit